MGQVSAMRQRFLDSSVCVSMYAREINEVLKTKTKQTKNKQKNGTLHNFVQCSCKTIEQNCFIYPKMYHGD